MFARNLEPGTRNALIVLLALTSGLSCSDGGRADVVRGQQLYENGKYLEAYEAYQRVLRQEGGPEIRFNTGNTLYRMRQYNDAARTWREALNAAPDVKQNAFYNMGNAYVRAAQDANALSRYLDRAVEAYEEALRLNPADQEAKWNLEVALRRRGDTSERGSQGRGGRADYGRGSQEEGYDANRQTAVGAMAGGGQGGDEGESVEELDEQQARALLEEVERQQLSTHEGRRQQKGGTANRDW